MSFWEGEKVGPLGWKVCGVLSGFSHVPDPKITLYLWTSKSFGILGGLSKSQETGQPVPALWLPSGLSPLLPLLRSGKALTLDFRLSLRFLWPYHNNPRNEIAHTRKLISFSQ